MRVSPDPFPYDVQDWYQLQMALDEVRGESIDDDYIEALIWMMAVEQHLGPFEDPDEFVCRKDPDTLVDSAQCASCPLNTNCFPIMEADILDAERRLIEE